jgi:cellulose synthase/poly-beta-1,6-N-acetylglucosamine synthase-like glycosyltransferase
MNKYPESTFTFLNKPEYITKHQWGPDALPYVSIICNTYNHEKFIEYAIKGFLSQKTTFPVEILIHDDASTDSTQEIIHRYEIQHSNLFKPIYQTDNQKSQGIKPGLTYQLPVDQHPNGATDRHPNRASKSERFSLGRPRLVTCL